MTIWTLLTTAWRPEPTVIVGCAALLLAYGGALRRGGAAVQPGSGVTGRLLLFVAGVLIMLFALISPLDVLGDGYLFSAHMVQHLVLVLAVPPLLLLGVPPRLMEELLSWRPAAHAAGLLGHPLVAWSLGTATMWTWHVPALYNAALAHPGIHALQHLSFLVTATIFWWPIVAPAAWRRLPPVGIVLYLFAAAAANTVLGIALTFAPVGLYPAYLHPTDTLGLMHLVRHEWGITPAVDQQVGGLFMWMATGPIYLSAVLATIVRWFGEPETTDAASAARSPHAA